jgi:hypothetical protein
MEDISENKNVESTNIKYKQLVLNGVPLQESKSSNNLTNLDKFLENEKNNNSNEPWGKLNKTIKTKKLQDYVEVYKTKNNLNNEEGELLFLFLKDCIDRKKLQRVKDVLYDKDNGTIKDIPSLHYIKSNKHFTLKNMDKRVSTLKSLAPKKTQGTIRKKDKNQNNDNDSEEDDEN